MRTHSLLSLILCLTACGGASSSTPEFSDPVAALAAADAAQAASNSETALAGYAYAFEFGDPQTQGDALLGQLDLYIANGEENTASTQLQRLQEGHATRLDQETLLQLLHACSGEYMADLGDSLVAHASAHFPNLQAQLVAFEASFLAIRENAASADVEQTGYVDN